MIPINAKWIKMFISTETARPNSLNCLKKFIGPAFIFFMKSADK